MSKHPSSSRPVSSPSVEPSGHPAHTAGAPAQGVGTAAHSVGTPAHPVGTPAQIVITPEQQKQLNAYTSLLLQWNKTHNLIGRSTTADTAVRHLEDSAQLTPHLPTQKCRVLDVGSGAGLPGLVLAITAPQHDYVLCERLSKKAAFLRIAATQLGLKNVTVFGEDCTLLPPASFEVITARAVAALSDLFPLTEALLKAQNTPLEAPFGSPYWLLLKGRAADEELGAYPPSRNMTIHTTPSITDSSGVILRCHPGRV